MSNTKSYSSKKVIFDLGDLIYSPLSSFKKVFIIQKGHVVAFTLDSNGKKKIHLIYGPGDYFPVITSFEDKQQRASYEAISRTMLEVYSREDFKEKIDNDQNFCKTILLKTVSQLSLFADNILDLTKTGLQNKLLVRIKLLIKQHGVEKDNTLFLPFPLTHQQLADMLGVERESISRIINPLKTKHAIQIDNKGVISLPK